MHLPAMIFGHNQLLIRLESSSKVLAFNAKVVCVLKEYMSLRCYVLVQGSLSSWATQHVDPNRSVVITKVPYAWSQQHSSSGAHGAEDIPEQVWDWTYTSDYCCS